MGTKRIEGNLMIEGDLYAEVFSADGADIESLYVDGFAEIDANLKVHGSLTLPNSPTTPDTATVTDTYTLRQTANADTTGLTVVDGSMATVEKVSGDTVKCENLVSFTTGTNGGVTFTAENGVITVSGTTGSSAADYKSNLPTLQIGKTYTYHLHASSYSHFNGHVQVYKGGTLVKNLATDHGQGATFTVTEDLYADGQYLRVNMYCGATNTEYNLTCTPMLNEGSTALPFQPYFTGLKHAFIDSIKSTGSNLINQNLLIGKTGISKATFEGYDCIKLTKGTALLPFYCKAGETVRLSVDLASELYLDTYWLFLYADGTYSNSLLGFSDNGNHSFERKIAVARTPSKDVVGVEIRVFSTTILYIKDMMMNYGETALPYTEYTEETWQLPETLELAEWDSLNPQTGEVTKKTETITITGNSFTSELALVGTYAIAKTVMLSKPQLQVEYTERVPAIAGGGFEQKVGYYSYAMDGVNSIKQAIKCFAIGSRNRQYARIYLPLSLASTDEEFIAYFNDNPLTIAYELAEPTVEKINAPKYYTAWDKGSEMVNVGDIDNTADGAIVEITQSYSIMENPTEAATKAYVNNGLAKKLDKTGGTITGTLTVEGETDSALSALVVKNDEVTYGLAYEGDAYKLGKGTVDENNNFAFDSNEGLPIALRADSSEFADGHYVKWSTEGNKFVDGGDKVDLSEYVKKDTSVSSYNKVYGVDTTGTQEMYPITAAGVANSLVFRDANGIFEVSAPTNNNEVANKQYVDTNKGTKIYKHTVSDGNELNIEIFSLDPFIIDDMLYLESAVKQAIIAKSNGKTILECYYDGSDVNIYTVKAGQIAAEKFSDMLHITDTITEI